MTQGIGHLVRFSLHVYEFEPVALHFLDPASLTMRQIGGGVLKQIPEWCIVGPQDEVAVTQLEPQGLRHCHYHRQPLTIGGVVTRLRWQEFPTPNRPPASIRSFPHKIALVGLLPLLG